MTTKVTKAIFPIAGMGTRFLPQQKPHQKKCLRSWIGQSRMGCYGGS